MGRFTVFVLAACFALPALAKYEPWPPQKWPPFEWPEAFSVTTSETSVSKGGQPVTNLYRRDDELVRIDVGGARAPSEVQIFDTGAHKQYRFIPGGGVQEAPLPEDWRLATFYPEGAQWEALGIDPFNGKKSLKYKVWRKPEEVAGGQPPFVFFWLSTNHKTPLRMIDGDRRIDFLDYAEGPPEDDSVFETPTR